MTTGIGNDDCSRPHKLVRLVAAEQQGRLMDDIAEAMQGLPVDVVKRRIVHVPLADKTYGRGIAPRMGLCRGIALHHSRGTRHRGAHGALLEIIPTMPQQNAAS